MHVVLDTGDLPTQQLEAVVDIGDVTGERVATGHPMVDVGLAAFHVEVLGLELRQLDLCLDLVVVVPPVGADARDVVRADCVVGPETFAGVRVVAVNVPDAVRIGPLPDAGGRIGE